MYPNTIAQMHIEQQAKGAIPTEFRETNFNKMIAKVIDSRTRQRLSHDANNVQFDQRFDRQRLFSALFRPIHHCCHSLLSCVS
jgi:hypothetical protein